MKSKLFKSLIAVLLVISLVPTAVFAAEEEHTHDETCGTVEEASGCAHMIQTELGAGYDYIREDETRHAVIYGNQSMCTICYNIIIDPINVYYEYHDWDPISLRRTEEEQGEITYYCNVECSKCDAVSILGYDYDPFA